MRRPELNVSSSSAFLRLGIFFSESFHCHGSDDLRRQRTVAVVRICLSDLIHHIHALRNLAKGCVSAVQMGCGFVHDEELRAGGIGVHCPRHGEYARRVFKLVRETVLGEFALNAVAGAPIPVPSGHPPWIIKPEMTRWKIRPS